jgi:hydrogenase/urease accessory protein HupE
MHHIFIGIDHILFVLGLMLLGGTVKRLLLVTTAFTLAHSLTLVLASLKIFTPPPQIVEPAIALSIVVIGLHAFLHRGKADHRISLAFVLGLLHGFGFAGVLQDLNLPTDAFAISLAGFNIGVELGQAVILLVTVPTMALLFKKLPRQAAVVVSTATLAIITVGSYWFVERIL